MSLAHELDLRKGFATVAHEALLNICFTASCMRKEAVRFLEPYGLTDSQLNLLMLLHHQVPSGEGLSQRALSRMLLVKPANTTLLINRLERAGLVKRTAAPRDRRYNVICLTARARRLLARVEPAYGRKVAQVMNVLTPQDQRALIWMLEEVRTRIRPSA